MSRHMQIDIRLIPFYEKPFKKAFPKLAELLKEHGYTTPLEREVSLYDLVDILVDMTYAPSVSKDVKERIDSPVSTLRDLKETAREQLLARHLNELDATLYLMEDAFDELEKRL